MLLFPLAKILKLSIATGLLQESAWALMLEWGGEVRKAPVLKLLPACSATLVWSVRMVEPTYSDTHCVQLNLYTREEYKEIGSLSLYEKRDPIFWLLTRIIWKSIYEKYFDSNLIRQFNSKFFRTDNQNKAKISKISSY